MMHNILAPSTCTAVKFIMCPVTRAIGGNFIFENRMHRSGEINFSIFAALIKGPNFELNKITTFTRVAGDF